MGRKKKEKKDSNVCLMCKKETNDKFNDIPICRTHSKDKDFMEWFRNKEKELRRK